MLQEAGAPLLASVLDTVERSLDNLSFDPSIFLLKPNTSNEGLSFGEHIHYPNTDHVSCSPTLKVHLFKCLQMHRVMTHHRCSLFRDFKADFDPAHTILDKRQNKFFIL